MNDTLESILSRHRGGSLLIDTNVLLLYVVGSFDRSLIARFGRTNAYTEDDFELLLLLIQEVPHLVTTPHVLTEVSNFLGHLSEPLRSVLFETTLKDLISRCEEHEIDAKSLTEGPVFTALGLTDAAILSLQKSCLILTVDRRLTDYLFFGDRDFVNFNHLRTQYWS